MQEVFTDYKFVVAVNKKIDAAKAMNAIGHMVAALVARAPADLVEKMSVVDYKDRMNRSHPVSGLSLVVLSAKNGNQLKNARSAAIQAGLAVTDFLESMTGDTYVEQMERTAQLSDDDLAY